ncbi:hypothetical protein [Vibrio splendidus]|uniref:hypothetical protein n=1 Tax=Vibrio splendidus TaxID=29497 RepID=UPI000D3380A0|nr:hypothetical protein [Vibrio splendidus]PTP67773.1 hypothetical protein CWO31_04910 [Vibrio splendidus]
MKNPLNTFTFIVLGATLILAHTLGSAFSKDLTSLSINTSGTSFGNWAMWVGAFGTVGTLFFLIRQNNIILKRQQTIEAENRRSKHLELNEIRKRNFYDLLEELERYSSPTIHFERKLNLYNSIYTIPKFLESESKESNQKLDHNSEFLMDLRSTYLSLITQLHLFEVEPQAKKHRALLTFLDLLSQLHSQLNMTLSEEAKYGDLVDLKRRMTPVLNIFDIPRDLKLALDIANHIFKLAEFEFDSPQITIAHGTSDLIKIQVLKTSGIGGYRPNMPKVSRHIVRTLCSAYELIFLRAYIFSDIEEESLDFNCLGQLIGVFSIKQTFFALLENENDQRELFSDIQCEIESYIFSGELPKDSPHRFSQLLEDINKSLKLLIKQDS